MSRVDASQEGISGDAATDEVDRRRSRSLFPLSPTRVFLLGVAIGLILTFVQSAAVGGPPGMLMVGRSSNLAEFIESELGPVPRAPGSGHDGQIVYAIASDLTGETVPPLLDHAGYRYRRILFPAAASLFGLLDGRELLWSMLAWNVLAFGAGAGALAALTRDRSRSAWATAGVLANPGLWLSINLVTIDVMAVSLALLGLVAASKRRHSLAILLLALTALTKDQYLVVAVGCSIFYALRGRSALSMRYLLAGVPLLGWTAFLNLSIESAFSPRSNFGLPFVGLWNSVNAWDMVSASDVAYGMLLVGAMVSGVVALALRRNRELWPFALPWIAMAVLASDWVWLLGNNALRSLAPLIIWTAFAFSPRQRAPSSG